MCISPISFHQGEGILCVCAFYPFPSTSGRVGWKGIAEMHTRMCISPIPFHPTHPLVEANCRNAHTYVHFCKFLPPGGGYGGRKSQKCTYVCTLAQFSFHQGEGRVEGICRNAHTYVHFMQFPSTSGRVGWREMAEMHIRTVCAFLQFPQTLPSPWWKKVAEMHIRM